MSGEKRGGHKALSLLWGILGTYVLLCLLSRDFADLMLNRLCLSAMGRLHRLSAPLSFPLLEPLALSVAAIALFTLVLAAVQALERGSLSPLRRWVKGMLWAALILGGTLAALWIPACAATPLEAPPVPDAGQLEWLCESLIDALDQGALSFSPPDEIVRIAPQVAGMAGRVVKAVRYPVWMRAAGISGLFVPLTGEALIDSTAPSPLLPFTAVHELMHLRGIADEGAANIAAWQRCLAAGGEFADSARLWALRYALGMLRQADVAAWQDAYIKMEGALANTFREINGEAATGNPSPAGALGLPAAYGDYTALVGHLIAQGLS